MPLLKESTQYDFESIQSANAYSEAEANGCYVKLPAENELFVDIDEPEQETWFHRNIGKIEEHIGPCTSVWTQSPSGEPSRKHVVITLARKVEPLERILLQAILGSDLLRWVHQDENPTLFYEKKLLQLPTTEPALLTTGEKQ